MDFSETTRYKKIKITSKNQITIPKEFFGDLDQNSYFDAYLKEDSLILKLVKPVRSPYEEEVLSVVSELLAQGFKGPDLTRNLEKRLETLSVSNEGKMTSF